MIEGGGARVVARAAGQGVARARRLSASLRKLVLSAHVLVAVGWFGVVAGKLVLELAAETASGQDTSPAAYLAIQIFDRTIFPPLAISTLLTGVILAVGTAWGLFRHYWILVKIALTLAVIVTGVALVGAWVEEARVAGSATPAARLISASLAHLLMLGAATVISIHKPWGRIGRDRRV